MADPQRTHKATPKRVKEFRKRGEIALSRDVVTAATFAGGSIALIATGATAFGALRTFARDAALAADGSDAVHIGHEAATTFFTAITPVVVGAALGALAAILGQLGWPPAFKGIKLDLSRLSPFSNLPNVFAPGQVARRTGGAAMKLVAVGSVVAIALAGIATQRPTSAASLASLASTTIARALESVIGALLALGAVDFILARRKIQSQMKMTTEEVKREHKESDGDPHIKGKRRQKMKQMARRRMQAAVKSADVVVVNPTHYAVALRYDDKRDVAPVVVAKGVDEAAAKIREVARKHGVPVLSRPPLARALHKLVDENKAVPSNLYKAVAEVLAFVYRIKHRSAS
ncbi:MAG TPA: EscU/YscU/HrcU family type III secretion system export apparatus switch protein [Kofleriaceae bacterium]